MIYILKRADVEAIKNYFTLELVPVLFDVVVLNHDDNHIYIGEELIEVVILVFCDLIADEERIVALERTGKMTLLKLEHLESWRLTIIIDILLISKTIETYFAVIVDVVLLHDLVDTVEDELRLTVVGFHRLVDNLSETWIVTYEEPRIYRDAVTTYTRTWLEDVYAWVHVTNLDDLVHVHIVITADAKPFMTRR
mgnify:FL=1